MHAESKDQSHQTCLAIDILNKTAYLVDPNGSSSYFNTIFEKISHDLYIDINSYVDKLLECYFSELNKIGIKIEFIPGSKWNKNKICINRNFDKSLIGSGHCVITTIMLGHYLLTTNLNPSDVYNKFKYISDDNLLILINSYMFGIYELMQSL
jgi:hypothetical protein